MTIKPVDDNRYSDVYQHTDPKKTPKIPARLHSFFKKVCHLFYRPSHPHTVEKHSKIQKKVTQTNKSFGHRIADFFRKLIGIFSLKKQETPSLKTHSLGASSSISDAIARSNFNYQKHLQTMALLRADLQEKGWVTKGIDRENGYQISPGIPLLDDFIKKTAGTETMKEERKTAQNDLLFLKNLVQTDDKIMTRKTRVDELSKELEVPLKTVKAFYNTYVQSSEAGLLKDKEQIKQIEGAMKEVWETMSEADQNTGSFPSEYPALVKQRQELMQALDVRRIESEHQLIPEMAHNPHLAAVFADVKKFEDQGFMDFVCRVDTLSHTLFTQPDTEQTQFVLICALESIKHFRPDIYSQLLQQARKLFSYDADLDSLQIYKIMCMNEFAASLKEN